MPDQWMLRGAEYANCNCAWGCPCQFNAPATYGFCEAVSGGHIDEGHFNDVKLDGLDFAMLLQWPGQIAEGNGKQQIIIDSRADEQQRVVLEKILLGESTAPGATHFFVFNSTMSEVLETLYESIEFDVDIERRKARLKVGDLIESTGSPVIDPNSGQEFRARIHLPKGFEYTYADTGTAESRVRAGIQLDLSGTYAQFNELHMNQDGVIR